MKQELDFYSKTNLKSYNLNEIGKLYDFSSGKRGGFILTVI